MEENDDMKTEIKDELTNLAKQISETFATFHALDDENILFGTSDDQVDLIVREKLDRMIEKLEQEQEQEQQTSSELKYVSFNDMDNEHSNESNEEVESNESEERFKLVDLDWQKLEEKMKEANRDYKIQVAFLIIIKILLIKKLRKII